MIKSGDGSRTQVLFTRAAAVGWSLLALICAASSAIKSELHFQKSDALFYASRQTQWLVSP